MLTSFQWIIFIAILLLGLNYLTIIAYDRFVKPRPFIYDKHEGFVGQSEESKYEWLENDAIYDSFYVDIYDKITQGAARSQAEATLIIKEWEKISNEPRTSWTILDIGAGTGITAAAMAKMNIPRVICLDRSDAMLQHIRNTTIPATTLSEEQKKGIITRKGDFLDTNIIGPSECSHAYMTYFTIYYASDIEALFRNITSWVKPGGSLAIEVVNKYKFDPILDSASPFIFSTQKYSETRRLKSKVAFDKFEYEAEFDMENDPQIEFRETFRFKDSTVRRQRHKLHMPTINEIVKSATYAGWTYKGYTDLVGIGFEYAYLLYFTH
jgi:SAM-dependent methyltransferase